MPLAGAEWNPAGLPPLPKRVRLARGAVATSSGSTGRSAVAPSHGSSGRHHINRQQQSAAHTQRSQRWRLAATTLAAAAVQRCSPAALGHPARLTAGDGWRTLGGRGGIEPCLCGATHAGVRLSLLRSTTAGCRTRPPSGGPGDAGLGSSRARRPADQHRRSGTSTDALGSGLPTDAGPIF